MLLAFHYTYKVVNYLCPKEVFHDSANTSTAVSRKCLGFWKFMCTDCIRLDKRHNDLWYRERLSGTCYWHMKCKVITGNSGQITRYKVICSQLFPGLSPLLSTQEKFPWFLGKQLPGAVFNGICRLRRICFFKPCTWENTLLLSTKYELECLFLYLRKQKSFQIQKYYLKVTYSISC